jgi:hypothetical protein
MLAAMMMFKFNGPVKTEGAVAVACSAFVRPRLQSTPLKVQMKWTKKNASTASGK